MNGMPFPLICAYMNQHGAIDLKSFRMKRLSENSMHSVGLGVDLLFYYDALLRVDFSRNARGEWVSRLVLRHAI